MLSTDTISLAKAAISKKCGLPEDEQYLASDGIEVTTNEQTLWDWAMDVVKETYGKPSVLRTLDKIKKWDITLKKSKIVLNLFMCKYFNKILSL